MTLLKTNCNCGVACQADELDLSISQGQTSIEGSFKQIRRESNFLESIGDTDNEVNEMTDFSPAIYNRSSPAFDYVKSSLEAYGFKRGVEINKLENLNILGSSFTIVNIFYKNFDISKVEEQAADSVVSVISDVGGQLGLWLGMSMVSILEILYCCICRPYFKQ